MLEKTNNTIKVSEQVYLIKDQSCESHRLFLLCLARNDLTKFILYDEPGIKHLVENILGLLCRSSLRLRLLQFIFELHDPLFSLVSLRQPFELLQLDFFKFSPCSASLGPNLEQVSRVAFLGRHSCRVLDDVHYLWVNLDVHIMPLSKRIISELDP